MPSPQTVIEAVTRALSIETADGRPLEAVRTVIADDSDTTGYNRSKRTPAIIIQVSSLTRRDLEQSWSGEWEYGTDENGNRIQGRVLSEGWQLTLSATVITGTVQGREDPDASRRAVVNRLGTVLSYYDTELREAAAASLPDENGQPLQNVDQFRDGGGDPYGTSTSARQFERDITIQFTNEVSELQWGGTPVIETVVAPALGEVYGNPQIEDGVVGIPDDERVQEEIGTSGQ